MTYTLRITNTNIQHIIDSVCLEENLLNALKNIIVRYDSSYVHFVYVIFSVYLKSYVQLTDIHSNLTDADRRYLLNHFQSLVNGNLLENNILVADRYDIIYGTSPIAYFESGRFNDYFYDDMYSRISNLYGKEFVDLYMHEIFLAAEAVIQSIEGIIVQLVCKDEEERSTSIGIQLQIYNNDLYMFLVC